MLLVPAALEVVAPPGEEVQVLERLIVSPKLGAFRATPPQTFTTEGEIVYTGQVVGFVGTPGDEHPVVSPFTGFLMGMMAADGERVREGQPVAWLRLP